MKNKRIIFRIIAVATLVCVALTCLALFAACNKNKTKSVADVFKSRENFGELTSSKREFALPAGWEVYTNSTTQTSPKDPAEFSDVGYIPELDAFIVSLKQGSSTKLSVVKCGDNTDYKNGMMNGMMFSPSQGIRALRYKDGLFACLFDDGTAGAFDATTGREVLSRSKFGKEQNKNSEGYFDTNDEKIDNVIKVLCAGLIAVHYNYDHSGQNGYISMYRPTYEGAQGQRGELVCRVKSSVGLSQVEGFDGKYATVSGTSNGEYIFRIPDHAPMSGVESVDSTSKGTFTTNSKTNYSDEATYLGNGKFYVCQDWEVSEGNDYAYYNGSKYVDIKHGIYNADNDSFTEMGKDKVFCGLTNNYYTSSKAGVDTKQYLKDGYTYVTFGITVDESGGKRMGRYDQFIIDKDMNVVMSLSGNFGVTMKEQKKGSVNCFDLLMYGVSGVYYAPQQPGEINIFDSNGKLVGHNGRAEIKNQQFNNNIFVAEMTGESSASSLFGAYGKDGDLLVPFEYELLKAYRGSYTIGRRYGKADIEGESTYTRYLRLIGLDGKEIDEVEMIDKDGNITKGKPFSDISYRTTSSTSITNAMFETGCYMFRVDTSESGKSGVYKYGVRNFSPGYRDSEIMPATMEAGSMLYSCISSPFDVFVFEKTAGTGANDFVYIVYRLL